MRDYAPAKGKYVVPTAVWNRTIWLIRDYDRMKFEADTILTSMSSGIVITGTPSDIPDHTARKAILRTKYLDAIKVIEKAMEEIPEEYRKGIWNSIQYRDRYPHDAAPETYSRQKQKYIKKIAEAMNYI